ncbi:MAG TPA: DUF58 domain-containing protein [Actinomycetes bacterium]|nr:DUF58 domain-containing protein [Actinomycetes bacterium]
MRLTRHLRGLRAFTPRALGFAACSLALYAAGLLTGVAELFMLALAGLLLPLAAWLVVRTGRRRVGASRSVRPLRAAQGSRITVDLTVENTGLLDTGVLLVTDRVPFQLGAAARFVLPGIPGDARERIRYSLHAAARGRYAIGPTAARLSDPFDLAQVTMELARPTEVIVHPRVEPLSAPGFSGELASAPVARVRRLNAAGEEFYTTREYREGDDLRKVHWRSSAKRGELMIRQDESPRQARALVAVDLRRRVHRGSDEHSSLERAVSAAASVVVRLAAAGYELACLTDDGREVRPAGRADASVTILDFLATVTASGGDSLAPLAARLARAGEGLLVAVLAAPTAEEAAALARCRQSFAGTLALLVRPDSWGTRGARETAEADARSAGAASLLERAGWRTATLERGERLDTPWRHLTRAQGSGGRLAGLRRHG